MTSSFKMREHVLERGRLAAPPGRHRRQSQRLAEQPLGESRKESEPRGGLEHAAAESVRRVRRGPLVRLPTRPGTPSAESLRSSSGSQ